MNYDIHEMIKINSNVDLGLPYFEVERVDPNLKIMVEDFEFDKRECTGLIYGSMDARTRVLFIMNATSLAWKINCS